MMRNYLIFWSIGCKFGENKKKKQYKLCKIKDSGTRDWKQGVMYEQIESGLFFVREKKEFFERFKIVEE